MTPTRSHSTRLTPRTGHSPRPVDLPRWQRLSGRTSAKGCGRKSGLGCATAGKAQPRCRFEAVDGVREATASSAESLWETLVPDPVRGRRPGRRAVQRNSLAIRDGTLENATEVGKNLAAGWRIVHGGTTACIIRVDRPACRLEESTTVTKPQCILLWSVALLASLPPAVRADFYQETSLVSSVNGLPPNFDASLQNPWGVSSRLPGRSGCPTKSRGTRPFTTRPASSRAWSSRSRPARPAGTRPDRSSTPPRAISSCRWREIGLPL